MNNVSGIDSYRALAKDTTRAFAAFALANLYMLRHRLTPQGT